MTSHLRNLQSPLLRTAFLSRCATECSLVRRGQQLGQLPPGDDADQPREPEAPLASGDLREAHEEVEEASETVQQEAQRR